MAKNIKEFRELVRLIRSGSYEELKSSLERGMNANSSNMRGRNLLMVATNRGEYKMVELLLQHGASVHACNDSAMTVIFPAVKNNDMKIFDLLVNNGAHVNVMTIEGKTPLKLAQRKDYKAMTGRLLELGADPNLGKHNAKKLKASNVHTKFRDAAKWIREGNLEEVEILIAKKDYSPNLENGRGRSLLAVAVHQNKLDIAQFLLSKGANPNLVNKGGRTPGFIAARNGNVDMLKLLIKYNANMNIATPKGKTPLMVASKRGHEGVVTILTNISGPTLEKKSLFSDRLSRKDTSGFHKVEKRNRGPKPNL